MNKSMLHSNGLPTCQLIATGGTIAMQVEPSQAAPVPALTGEALVRLVPAIANIANLEVINFSNMPSSYIGPQQWIALHQVVVAALNRPDIVGVVLSHGTDTLEETGWFLDLAVSHPKPIVLIGAQRNASEPDFDGPRNLLDGVRVCVSRDARDKGAMIVMNSQINAARDATKTHTSNVDTFKSGDFGLLGTVDSDSVVFSRSPTRRQHLELTTSMLPRVDIVAMYPGADGEFIRAAIQLGVKGIVLQALGAGNVNIDMYEAITTVIGVGIHVVISTRVQQGRARPVYGFLGGGKTLMEAGAIFANDLSPQKARILLMLALQAPRTQSDIRRLFDR